MEELEQIVAANLTALRKRRMWTQAELAQKIHYSDKSVSKWERGESLPDLKVLKNLADLFGVTVDYFLTENAAQSPEQYMAPTARRRYQIWVTSLALCFVWLIATTVYVYVAIYGDIYFWQAFVWAIPASMLVLNYFDRRWFCKRGATVIASVLCWSLITAVFLQWLSYGMWMLFLLGVPVQAALILLAQIKKANKSL